MMRVTPLFTRPCASTAGAWLRCALLLGVLGCESRAPAVQSEPSSAAPQRAEPARTAPVGDVVPTSPSSEASGAPHAGLHPQGELTRFAVAKDEARPEGAAPTTTAGGAQLAQRAAPTPAPSPAAPSPATPAPAAPSPGNAGEPTLGAVVNDDAFSTWLQAPSPATAGAATYVEAVLVAKAPYHCNAEYPHKFKLGAPSPGVSYPEETVRGMQVTPERSVLRIPLQAANAGLAKVSGTLSFSVCTEERCLVEKRDLTLDLQVK